MTKKYITAIALHMVMRITASSQDYINNETPVLAFTTLLHGQLPLIIKVSANSPKNISKNTHITTPEYSQDMMHPQISSTSNISLESCTPSNK